MMQVNYTNMQLEQCGKDVFGFYMCMQGSNMFLYFRNNLVLKIKVHVKVLERRFL
jgi:hypothetical protein